MGAGALLAAVFGAAGDLAQHQPVRHRPGAEPVRRRLLGLRRHQLRAGEAARAAAASPFPCWATSRWSARRCSASTRWSTWRSPWWRGWSGSSTARAPGWCCARSANRRIRRMRWAIRCAASGWRRWWPAARCAGWPAPTSSMIYTPLWVEGMVAGKGWIALALTTFATWRPGAGAAGRLPVRRRHHAAVPLPGHRRGRAQPVPHHAAVPRHHRGAGADLAQPGLDPRSTCRPRLASRFIPAHNRVFRHNHSRRRNST